MKRKLLFGISLWCVTTIAAAQSERTAAASFPLPGMSRIEGLFPVYTAGQEIYLEIPRRYIGQEVSFTAQIDRGFDLLNRPANSLGVVQLSQPDSATLCFNRPFYTERILDPQSPHVQPFAPSNVQPQGQAYPVVGNSETGGVVIRLTDLLLQESEWLNYSHNFIRSAVSGLSEVIGIHPFAEGVTFTVRRYHEAEPDHYQFASTAVVLPAGSLPIEVSCTLRLLPQQRDRIRLADARMPFRSLRFKDYSQDPYNLVEDSLICRWNLSQQPLTFYVDSLFPQQYYETVRRGITAWNDALRRAGAPHLLQVKRASKGMVAAVQPAFVSYDLRLPGVHSHTLHHPRTGEILSARLNIGHGFLRERIDDYLLSCGATDSRIGKERFSSAIEQELMQNEVTREVGVLLGLRVCQPTIGCGAPARVSEADTRAIGFGYAPIRKGEHPYAERERLRKQIAALPPLQTTQPDVPAAIEQLQNVVERLETWVYPNGVATDRGQAFNALYRKAIRRYATLLTELAHTVGSDRASNRQKEAMQHLERYLFCPDRPLMENAYARTNLLENREKLLYPQLAQLFDHLLSPQTIATLMRQGLQPAEAIYDDVAHFAHLRRALFADFVSTAPIDYLRMDLQLLCIERWVAQLAISTPERVAIARLARELQELHRQLTQLSQSHPQEEVRLFYALLASRAAKAL